jgi:putative thioredoxin
MHAVDVNEADFDEKVIAASYKQPVVVDFWAPWCAPCKVLKPILEKLADEYAGKFLLAKVNSDECPDISFQYGVRGIPSVKAIVNGRPVDEFTGALPEREVRAWLKKIIPSPAEELRLAAQQLVATGDTDGAMQKLAEASALDPNNERVRVDNAELLLAKGQVAEARQLLNSLRDPEVANEDRVLKLAALARLQSGVSGADEAALAAAIAANANDLEARLKLANLLVASKRYAEGMDQLLEIVMRDRGFKDDIGRKTLLDAFSLLGGEGALVTNYRRKLSGLLNR